MRKIFFSVILALCPLMSIMAATDSVHVSQRYSLTALVEYSYNKSWGHFANIDAKALLPVNRHFEMALNAQASFKNVYTFGVIARPKFPLPYGELFIDTELLYKAVMRVRQMDFAMAVSVGYRFDYLSFQVGMFSRVMGSYDRDWNSEEGYNVEPFNLLYRLEVFCRPQACNWNISAAVANCDDYNFERMWQPLFMLGGRYDVDNHWRVLLQAQCKPAGMFHLNAAFYGITIRTGFMYKF